MGCGCGKKSGSSVYFMGKNGQMSASPEEWGPILWKILHCLSESIGNTGNSIIDTDQANYTEFILQHLPSIIPCKECQEHAHSYISNNPVPVLKGMYGQTLKNTIRSWLLHFHNAVRTRKDQEITVLTLEEYQPLYSNCSVPQCEFVMLSQSVAYAIRQGWVKVDAWRKWYNFLDRLRVLSGNFIAK
jgi:hypothetical protein